jgi:nucleoside-diphosphate-sugar epimerase
VSLPGKSRVNNKNSKKITIYITGSTSDIGQCILKKLNYNKFKVIVLVRNIKIAKKLKNRSSIIYRKFDLNKPLEKINIDPNSILIHCAWENPRNVHSENHVDSVMPQHYTFIKKMVKKGVEKVIVIGTCAEFGITYGPVKANDETSPCTSYGSGKDFLHKSLRFLEKDNNFELIWLRIFNIYGESIDKNTVTSLFSKAINDGLPEFPMSFGNQTFDYLLADDVAKRIINSLNKGSGIYHVCSAKPIKLKNLLTKIKKEKNSSIKLKLGRYPYRNHEPIAIWGEHDDLRIL